MSCDHLHAFLDGELSSDEADGFRTHLAGCPACQAELPRMMALIGTLDEHGTAAPADRPGASSSSSERAMPAPVRLPWRRRPLLAVAIGGAIAMAAAASLILSRRPSRPATTVAWVAPAASSRPSIARLAYPGASAYHPYAPTRGTPATAPTIALATLADLERQGDWYGVAVVSWWRGDRDAAARYFGMAAPSPDALVDQAALALSGTETIALAEALAVFDQVLRRDPRHPAARWNRAQTLAQLGLTRSAADALEAIAADGEPGWSDEARQTAATLRATATAEASDWQAAWDLGARMVADGTPMPAAIAAAHPGIARLMFYDAVRAAADAGAVRALRPLAEQLDAIAGGEHLRGLVDRVGEADFRRRAPLAAIYRALATGVDVAPSKTAALVAALDGTDPALDDLRLGAWYRLGLIDRHATRYEQLVAASGDPWFAALAGHRRGSALRARGEPDAAVAALRATLDAAVAARLGYRAELIELELAQLYLELDRLPDAAELAATAWARARAGGEAGHVAAALPVLGAVALHRFQLALARAYFEEWLAIQPGDCAIEPHGATHLAELALLERDHALARARLAQARRCPAVATSAQLTLAQLAIDVALWRDGGTAAQADVLDAELATLEAQPEAVSGQRAMVAALRAALTTARDPDAGTAALRAVVATTTAIPAPGPLTRRARSWATALLAVEAAGRDDGAAVLRLVAAARDLAPPARCTLAVAVDDERLVAAAIGAGGVAASQLDRAWRFPNAAPAPGQPWLDDRLTTLLADCAEIDVIALPPIEGAPGLLPPERAWSYRVGPPIAPSAAPPRRVRVTGVVSPGGLGLPLLPAPATATDPTVHELRGASATPRQVLAAMRDATEIELHTHGLADRARSDASYLVLSADDDGDFALTAARIAATTLTAAPLVTLAACRSARTEPYLHESSSLPRGFRQAGARAVLASSADLPDDEAERFFTAVRARAAGGASLAVALRDERLVWLRRDPTSWARDVLLFQ